MKIRKLIERLELYAEEYGCEYVYVIKTGKKGSQRIYDIYEDEDDGRGRAYIHIDKDSEVKR